MHQRLSTQGHAAFLTYYDDITGERTELSYATFDNWVGKTANLLSEEFNARRGSRVAVVVGTHWTAVVAAFACWRLGACAVPVPPEQIARLDEVLLEVKPDVIIAWEDVAGGLSGAVLAVGAGFGGRVTRGVGGAVSYGDEVLAFADDYDDPDVTLDDAAVLLLPPWSDAEAAVVLDQTNLLAAASAFGTWLGLGSDDRVLSDGPPGPVEGLVLGQLGPFAAGAASLLGRNLDPVTFARKIRDERVTWALPSPRLLQHLPGEGSDLTDPRPPAAPASPPSPIAPLRGFLCPSGAPPALQDRIERATGLRVLNGHGVASATGASSFEAVDLDLATRRELYDLPGRYAGSPTPWAQVEERDGELCVRGPVVMSGHDGPPDLDEAAFADGWLHTGDAGRTVEGSDGRAHVIVG